MGSSDVAKANVGPDSDTARADVDDRGRGRSPVDGVAKILRAVIAKRSCRGKFVDCTLGNRAILRADRNRLQHRWSHIKWEHVRGDSVEGGADRAGTNAGSHRQASSGSHAGTI